MAAEGVYLFYFLTWFSGSASPSDGGRLDSSRRRWQPKATSTGLHGLAVAFHYWLLYTWISSISMTMPPIDYSLPRMSFIRNEDFSYLVNSDRNITSRKSYGVLPIRDISLTPYGTPIQILLDAPQMILMKMATTIRRGRSQQQHLLQEASITEAEASS
ncbi:uncharacterized protein [Lolium perenne]|uniref:uncharacterized protein isoform X2 n=1 Tax=Lolium perenne TaxID=4522 RepID=UPI0021F63929|nr:uncharacterized protein LOC127341615 isoform X2 [Lolium perenne]